MSVAAWRAEPTHDMRLFTRDWGFRLADIRTPVFFWQGARDGIVPPAHGHHQASLVPAARLTVCADEGHFAGYASATPVFDLLATMFVEHEKGATANGVTA